MTLRVQIYEVMSPASDGHAARRVRALEILLILVGIITVSEGTVDGLTPTARALLAIVTGLASLVFLVEYLVRLWIAPEIPHLRSTTATSSRETEAKRRRATDVD